MPSVDLQRFKRSMSIGYEQWHEGIGYDLEALGRLTGAERAHAEELLLQRQAADWRDIDALDHLGTERALTAIEQALAVKALDVRIMAAERLAHRAILDEKRIESIIIEALSSVRLLNGLVVTLRFAQQHATPAVRLELMRCAVHGNIEIRTHAAALVHFLYGGSKSEFDWEHRPLYLRFQSPKLEERQAAFIELCHSVGIEPPALQ
jgi:hypothetical protein